MRWLVVLLAIAFVVGTLVLLLPRKKVSKEELVRKYNLIIQDCVKLCELAKNEINIEPGPCLSDIYKWNHPGWVCDVAHWPRQPIDDLKENQCKNWWVEARNFVEVNPECRPIKIYVYGETPEPVVLVES